MLSRRKTLSTFCATTLLIAGALATSGAAAQSSTAPIRLIVSFTAGGATDVLARSVAEKMAKILGQSIVIDNKVGAGGVVGTSLLAKANPDGLTIGLGTNGTHGINASLYSKLPYDAVKDFQPIVLLAANAGVVIVRAESQIGSLADLVAAAKASPDKLTMGSAGSGTTPHLAGILFNRTAGIKTTHVPYKGSAPAIADLLAGHTDYSFEAVSAATPFIKSGKVRALAVTSKSRALSIPEVSTLAELGYPSYDVTSWAAFIAPAGTPAEVVQRLNAAANKALADPDLRKRLEGLSYTPLGGTVEAAALAVRKEVDRWPELVKESGARAD